MPLSDFLSAERLNELQDFSISKAVKNANFNKYTRATVQYINGDYANIKIGNSTTTIYNVKIRDGLALKVDDEVYVMYINGNSNNMFIDSKVDQLELMFDLYSKKEVKVIDRFQDSSLWTSGAGTQSDDFINKKFGDRALKIAEDDNTASTLYSTKSSISLDLFHFDYDEINETTPVAKVADQIFIGFYIDNVSYVNDITLTFTTSGGNYFEYTYSTLKTGWNLIRTTKSSFSETGSPDWSNITEIKLEWSSTSNASGKFVTFSALYLVQSNVEIDGEIVLINPMWDDLRFSATQTRQGSLLKPDFDYTNVGLLFPENNTDEILYIICQMPHTWKEGSTIYPHIHWTQNQNQAVNWEMDYKWYNNDEAVPAAFTNVDIYELEYTYTSGNFAQISLISSGISGTGKKISSMLLIKLWRNPTDSYSGDALFTEFDIHYQVDGFGSFLEYQK